MQQRSLFSTSEPAPLSLDVVLAALSRHGWDRVGVPKRRGSTTYYEFRRGTTDEFNELAEGELPYWLAQLDASAARWAALARKELPVLRYSRDARKRGEAETAARTAARRITDVELREQVYREIVAASMRREEA